MATRSRSFIGPFFQSIRRPAQFLTHSTVSSAANAANESGGEAEIAGGVGMERGAATRSLRSARGAAHRVAPPFMYGVGKIEISVSKVFLIPRLTGTLKSA